jgi:cytochrome P450
MNDQHRTGREMNEVESVRQEVLPWGNAQYVANPYPWYDNARKNFPIYRDMDGTYVVTRYEDVVRYGKLPSLSIVTPEGAPSGPWKALSATVLNLDPPKHTAARRPMNKWFTPKLVQKWVEAAESYVLNHLAKTANGEPFDANMQFGVGPSHAAMCNALQVPADDFEPVIFCMHRTMRALSETVSEAESEQATQAFEYMFGRVRDLLQWKRANPGEGMADALLAAYDNGDISEAQLVQSVVLLWGSGGHNPSYIISSGVEYFARHPGVFEIFKANPEKRPFFINEIYRLYPPELSFARFATEEIEIQGVNIKVGECVKFIIDSANRDQDIFPDADEMDLNRPANSLQGVSFGMGVHQCAGQTISRGGIDTVFRVLAENVDSFTLEGEPKMDNTGRSRAYVNLPISVVKSRR